MSDAVKVLMVLGTEGEYTLSELGVMSGLGIVQAWKAIQSLREQGYDIQQFTSTEHGQYVYSLETKENEMDTVEPSLQSRLMSRAQAINKETGQGMSRSVHAAADEIGPTLNPPMSGAELERWLGAQMRRKTKQEREEAPPSPGESLLVVEEEEIEPRVSTSALLLQQLVSALKNMPRGKTWSVMAATPEQAKELQKHLPRAARALGWHDGLPNAARSYESQVLPDRLRISRR